MTSLTVHSNHNVTLADMVRIANRLGNGRLWAVFAEAVAAPEMPVITPAHNNYSIDHVVLTSGGQDSTIAYTLSLEAGGNSVAVYIDFGQDYKEHELQVLARLEIGVMVEKIRVNYDERLPDWKHIMPARNLLALDAAGRLGGAGATVWLGAVKGEMPVQGGDKSRTFLTLAEEYLRQMYGTKKIQTLGKYTKAEWAFWWTESGHDPQVLIDPLTCYSPTESGLQCGKCQACLRKWVALILAGYDETAVLERYELHPMDNALEAKEKYITLMTDEIFLGHSTPHQKWYGLDRCRQTLTVLAPERIQGQLWDWSKDYNHYENPL